MKLDLSGHMHIASILKSVEGETRTFHITQEQFDELAAMKSNQIQIEEAIFPFDFVEICINNSEFRRATVAETGKPSDFLLGRVLNFKVLDIHIRTLGSVRTDNFEGVKRSVLITKNLEMKRIGEDIHYRAEEGIVAACFSNEKITSFDVPNSNSQPPEESKETTRARHITYTNLLSAYLRFCELLLHRGVETVAIPSPDAPKNRQQRRDMERQGRSSEGRHYEIVLRPKLSIRKACSDVREGKSLREHAPPRRHLVAMHLRCLTKGRETPKIVEVRGHQRGGKARPPKRSYDATALTPA